MPGLQGELSTTPHPTGCSPEADSLRALTKLWSHLRSGFVTVGTRRAELRGGEPATLQDLVQVVEMLYAGPLVFTAFANIGRGTTQLGPELWRAAQALGGQGAPLRPGMLVADTPRASCMGLLPLSDGTRRVMAGLGESRTDLLSQVRASQADPDVVRRELAALQVMGLVQLRGGPTSLSPADAGSSRALPARQPLAVGLRTPGTPSPSRPPLDRTPAPATPTTYSNPARPTWLEERTEPPVRSPLTTTRPPMTPGAAPTASGLLLRRLEREWDTIRTADDWTILAVPAGAAPDVVGRAADRMQDRYRQLLSDPSLDESCRTLAGRIHRRILDARERHQGGQPVRQQQSSLDIDTRIAEGKRLLDLGDFGRAARWLQAVHDERANDPAVLAMLAWAIWNLPEAPPTVRERKAESLVTLAQSIDATHPDPIVTVARMEVARNELISAEARLLRLVSQMPDHKVAADLLATVRARMR
jgi:hypothetical protein